MEITLAIGCFSFLAGVVITGALTVYAKDEAYADGYKEGWLDAKEMKVMHCLIFT